MHNPSEVKAAIKDLRNYQSVSVAWLQVRPEIWSELLCLSQRGEVWLLDCNGRFVGLRWRK